MTPSVYYNLVAEAVRLGAYCVPSPVAGCCHRSCVAAQCRKPALNGLLREVGGLGGVGSSREQAGKKFVHNNWVGKWPSPLLDPDCPVYLF